jgi:diguanylate cyclase (GGDEF)-like protein
MDVETSRRASRDKQPDLIIITERDFGRKYTLGEGETLIGRDGECAIRLQDSRVSRKHARIAGQFDPKEGFRFTVTDAGSTNGTFLNDKRIGEAVLRDGDRLGIGYTVFRYAVRGRTEAEYEDKIYRMATTDALTGLFSREYFMQHFTDTFRRSTRYHRPFSLMMLDIDDFKAINDTHGHPVGDTVLERAGRVIMDVVRQEDYAARYGGEEFAVLLPETSPADARHPAERLRKKLEAHRFTAGDTAFSVTISIGIAGYPDDGSSMEELVEHADRALYQAKRSGKNTVRVYHTEIR